MRRVPDGVLDAKESETTCCFAFNLINGKHMDDNGGGIVQKISTRSVCNPTDSQKQMVAIVFGCSASPKDWRGFNYSRLPHNP